MRNPQALSTSIEGPLLNDREGAIIITIGSKIRAIRLIRDSDCFESRSYRGNNYVHSTDLLKHLDEEIVHGQNRMA